MKYRHMQVKFDYFQLYSHVKYPPESHVVVYGGQKSIHIQKGGSK